MKRHWPTFSFASAFYLWGSLSPANNVERFLGGRVWELLPNYNPVAFFLALGIVGVGVGIAHLPELIAWARASDPRRLATRLTEELYNTALHQPARSRASANTSHRAPESRVAAEPGSTFHSTPLRHSPPAQTAPASGDANAAPMARVIDLDQSRARLRRDLSNAFGHTPKPVYELIRPCAPAPVDGDLTEPSVREVGRGRTKVTYLGITFAARTPYVEQHLDAFVETACKERIRFSFPEAFDLTDYLKEYPNETPSEALRSYQRATEPRELESDDDGPWAPERIGRLSCAGFSWEAPEALQLTWREISAFAAVARGARKGNPRLPASVEVSPLLGRPTRALEETLNALLRGQ